ncbi:MAG: DUF1840 domain-containing protein [Rhodocyclaceae bacterium]
MIITFKSRASADVIYFGDVARRLIELMGKEPAEQGIVTIEQLPEAIARLKAAIAADKESHRQLVQVDEPGYETPPDGGMRPLVSLTQRALPLLMMLEESLAAKEPVVWGV